MAALRYLTSLIVIWLATIFLVASQSCPDDKEPPFRRMMLLTFDGVGGTPGTYQLFSESYGSCKDVNANAERAFQFFESFGLNMTIPRRNPYKIVDLGNFVFRPVALIHPTSRALMETFYEYGEYINAPVHRTFWRAEMKADLNGPKGLIRNGTQLYFGLLRIVIHGRDFCVDYYSDVPVVKANNGFVNYKIFPLTIYNEHWGYGGATGILTDEFATKRRRHYFWILRFPADGLY